VLSKTQGRGDVFGKRHFQKLGKRGKKKDFTALWTRCLETKEKGIGAESAGRAEQQSCFAILARRKVASRRETDEFCKKASFQTGILEENGDAAVCYWMGPLSLHRRRVPGEKRARVGEGFSLKPCNEGWKVDLAQQESRGAVQKDSLTSGLSGETSFLVEYREKGPKGRRSR